VHPDRRANKAVNPDAGAIELAGLPVAQKAIATSNGLSAEKWRRPARPERIMKRSTYFYYYPGKINQHDLPGDPAT